MTLSPAARLVETLQRKAIRWAGRRRGADRLWRLVAETGIVVFVGPNGSGKSLAAVEAALTTLDGIPWVCRQWAHHHQADLRRHVSSCPDCTRPAGNVVDTSSLCQVGRLVADRTTVGDRLVYSTVPLLAADRTDHPLYRPLLDYTQLVTVEHSDVLFDEVAGVSDSSASASIPVQVVNWLHQLRKRDVRLRVTTPAYARCSLPIRQVAQVVVDCRSFFAEPATPGVLWRPRRAMLFDAFDAFAFDEFTAAKSGDRSARVASAAYWRADGRAQSSYDTLGAVLALGHVDESGMCSHCGGTRSRPRCACGPEVDEADPARVIVSEKVSAAGARVRTAFVLAEGGPSATVPGQDEGPTLVTSALPSTP